VSIKGVARDILPPAAWRLLIRSARLARQTIRGRRGGTTAAPRSQDLDVYWDPAMAAALETWGEGNTWNEIQYLLCLCRGRVLDIACGTGKAMIINSRFPQLELFGCDISDFLIDKARQRGIPEDRLRVCDATQTGYDDKFFDYAYSIGSLEHFTEEGSGRVLKECRRTTRLLSFHNIPVSRSGRDMGWITPNQSYFNNSVSWWLPKFHAVFPGVVVLDSSWNDDQSVGKWFVCTH
jgi:SAM-dependent methyltransferase